MTEQQSQKKKEKHEGKPVECPLCHHQFYYQRSRKGAGYATDWKLLIQPCINLLSWWLSNFTYERMSKDEILSKYKGTTMTALQARISELYALDLINRHEKEEGQYPTVTYSLNVKRVIEVLNNDGKLREESK